MCFVNLSHHCIGAWQCISECVNNVKASHKRWLFYHALAKCCLQSSNYFGIILLLRYLLGKNDLLTVIKLSFLLAFIILATMSYSSNYFAWSVFDEFYAIWSSMLHAGDDLRQTFVRNCYRQLPTLARLLYSYIVNLWINSSLTTVSKLRNDTGKLPPVSLIMPEKHEPFLHNYSEICGLKDVTFCLLSPDFILCHWVHNGST